MTSRTLIDPGVGRSCNIILRNGVFESMFNMTSTSIDVALTLLAGQHGTPMVAQVIAPGAAAHESNMEEEEAVARDIELAIKGMEGQPSSDAERLYAALRHDFTSGAMKAVTDEEIRTNFPS